MRSGDAFAVLPVAVLAMTCGAWGVAFAEPPTGTVSVKVRNHVLHEIDSRLFGQFMERPSWGGEIGPEGSLIPGTHELRREAKRLIRDMQIPIARFPGGTDVDYIDWLDMIDNVPGRPGGRPITIGHTGNRVSNHFGYDEFLRLCEEIEMEPSGQVTMLYSKHHGSKRLEVDLANVPRYEQPYRMAGIGPARSAAYLDILATRSQETLYLHCINRHFDSALVVEIDVSALDGRPKDEGTLHVLEGRLNNAPGVGEDPAPGQIREESLAIAGSPFPVQLPARSVTVVEVPLRVTASAPEGDHAQRRPEHADGLDQGGHRKGAGPPWVGVVGCGRQRSQSPRGTRRPPAPPVWASRPKRPKQDRPFCRRGSFPRHDPSAKSSPPAPPAAWAATRSGHPCTRTARGTSHDTVQVSLPGPTVQSAES